MGMSLHLDLLHDQAATELPLHFQLRHCRSGQLLDIQVKYSSPYLIIV